MRILTKRGKLSGMFSDSGKWWKCSVIVASGRNVQQYWQVVEMFSNSGTRWTRWWKCSVIVASGGIVQ